MVGVYWGFRRFTPSQMDRHFRRYQLVSAAFLSCAHGTNDAQKTMGIITAVLFAVGLQKDFHVPSWVIAASSAAIGLGTMSGGWRIVRTMGTRLTQLQPTLERSSGKRRHPTARIKSSIPIQPPGAAHGWRVDGCRNRLYRETDTFPDDLGASIFRLEFLLHHITAGLITRPL
jgi:hypothetical protein